MKWDIESEYPSLESVEYLSDLKKVQQGILSIKETVTGLQSKIYKISQLPDSEIKSLAKAFQKLMAQETELSMLAYNLGVYVGCHLSIDTGDQAAKKKRAELESLSVDLAQAFAPVSHTLKTCEEKFFQVVMEDEQARGSLFFWSEHRNLRPTLLSETEENLLSQMSINGLAAWGQLYETLSGSIKVDVQKDGKTEKLGLAQTASLIRMNNPALRKSAWQGIQKGWTENKDSAAAILNAIAGWRLDLNKKRSHTVPVHYLDRPCFDSRIQRETLNAMMTAVQDFRPQIRAFGFEMAKMMGKEKLDPWDLLAPAPFASSGKLLNYDEGMQLVEDSFRGFDPEFGDFAKMMKDKNWIEARVLPTKVTGAFCTGFIKSKTPRVFMSYLGSSSDVSTMAHELGHAFHSWVMRDLPLIQQDYPMTLAETASIFAEKLLLEHMLKKAKTPEEKKAELWGIYSDALSLLLNIPARYTFEKNFYEKRTQGPLSPEELSQLMDNAWTEWYGPVLSENEKMFWATKLHFSITGVSFYNFPYTFGYLFSLSIFARKDEYGKEFMKKYKAILRDTGRMTAEDVVMRHLGEDIRKPEFWMKTIKNTVLALPI